MDERMKQLQNEIERHVNPLDLLGLDDDDIVYVARCTAEKVLNIRRAKERVERESEEAVDESHRLELAAFRELAKGNTKSAFEYMMKSVDEGLKI